MGIWLKVDQDCTLQVRGTLPGETVVTLYPGWNMMGSFDDNQLPEAVDRVGYFDSTQEYNVS